MRQLLVELDAMPDKCDPGSARSSSRCRQPPGRQGKSRMQPCLLVAMRAMNGRKIAQRRSARHQQAAPPTGWLSPEAQERAQNFEVDSGTTAGEAVRICRVAILQLEDSRRVPSK